MQCLKCGRDISGKQVFCDSCLGIMSQYPVRPGTVIILPHRPAFEGVKKGGRKKRELSEREQIFNLRRKLRRACFAAAVLAIALAVLTAVFFHSQQEATGPAIGRNYTVDATNN